MEETLVTDEAEIKEAEIIKETPKEEDCCEKTKSENKNVYLWVGGIAIAVLVVVVAWLVVA